MKPIKTQIQRLTSQCKSLHILYATIKCETIRIMMQIKKIVHLFNNNLVCCFTTLPIYIDSRWK